MKMKNLKILSLIFITLFALQSCGDKDEVADEKANLVGVWNVNNFDFEISINDQSLATFFGSQEEANFYEAFLLLTFQDVYEELSIELKSDNTYSSMSPGEDPDTGTWSLDTNENTLTFDAGTEDESTFKIITSNGSTLVNHSSFSSSFTLCFSFIFMKTLPS